jgi:hypothetical protein
MLTGFSGVFHTAEDDITFAHGYIPKGKVTTNSGIRFVIECQS